MNRFDQLSVEVKYYSIRLVFITYEIMPIAVFVLKISGRDAIRSVKVLSHLRYSLLGRFLCAIQRVGHMT